MRITILYRTNCLRIRRDTFFQVYRPIQTPRIAEIDDRIRSPEASIILVGSHTGVKRRTLSQEKRASDAHPVPHMCELHGCPRSSMESGLEPSWERIRRDKTLTQSRAEVGLMSGSSISDAKG